MADLMDLLKGQMTNQVIDALSNQVGIGDKQQTATATNAIFSFLTNALAKNTNSGNGAGLLAGALDRDHDGSVLDDITGFLMNSAVRSDNASNGVGILGHLLGSNQNIAVDAIMRMTGLDQNKTASLMVKLAPVVMGVLGREKKQQHLSQNQLSDYISRSAKNAEPPRQASSLITRILDSDGDGSMYDELAGMGLKALGGLFR